MFHELIAVAEVNAVVRNRNAGTIRDDELYVVRQLNLLCNLMGHIDCIHLPHQPGDCNCQRTIPWSNFQVGKIGMQMVSEKGQPVIEIAFPSVSLSPGLELQ